MFMIKWILPTLYWRWWCFPLWTIRYMLTFMPVQKGVQLVYVQYRMTTAFFLFSGLIRFFPPHLIFRISISHLQQHGKWWIIIMNPLLIRQLGNSSVFNPSLVIKEQWAAVRRPGIQCIAQGHFGMQTVGRTWGSNWLPCGFRTTTLPTSYSHQND